MSVKHRGNITTKLFEQLKSLVLNYDHAEAYEVSEKYMIKLNKNDLEDEAKLEKLA